MYYTYILRSIINGRYYIGSTSNIARRLADHNSSNTHSTKPYRPWYLLYSESFETLAEARNRERVIKSWKSPRYMLDTLHLTV
jgi:putative endonuclease